MEGHLLTIGLIIYIGLVNILGHSKFWNEVLVLLLLLRVPKHIIYIFLVFTLMILSIMYMLCSGDVATKLVQHR